MSLIDKIRRKNTVKPLVSDHPRCMRRFSARALARGGLDTSTLRNLIPRALFPGFGSGAPRPQSQGKAPWGQGCTLRHGISCMQFLSYVYVKT